MPGVAGLEAFPTPPSAPGRSATADCAPLRFHRSLPAYAPPRCGEAPDLARRLGVARDLAEGRVRAPRPSGVQDRGRLVGGRDGAGQRLGVAPDAGLGALRAAIAAAGPLTLVAATDGNHGRAVAHLAAMLGARARIYIPGDMVPARREAIAAEDAEIVVVAGSYDETGRGPSAATARPDELVVSDTSWPGYETVPAAIVDGCGPTILWEIDDDLRRRGRPDPDTVLVPVGVGSLASAVVRHYRRPGLEHPPVIVSVEPTAAACSRRPGRARASASAANRTRSCRA